MAAVRIRTGIDHISPQEDRAGGSPITFPIWWECGQDHYPQAEWEDFGTVLLGWWLMAAVRLWAGADTDTFAFMDGPFAVHARMQRATNLLILTPEGGRNVWTTPFDELCEQLIETAEAVRIALQRADLAEDAQRSLSVGIRVLRATFVPPLSPTLAGV